MGIGKNREAVALAYKVAKAKTLKIAELGITPAFTDDQTDALIETLANAKAENPESIQAGKTADDFIKGQRWYVEDLIAYSALTAVERFDKEYADAFASVGDENELMAELEKLVNPTPEAA